MENQTQTVGQHSYPHLDNIHSVVNGLRLEQKSDIRIDPDVRAGVKLECHSMTFSEG